MDGDLLILGLINLEGDDTINNFPKEIESETCVVKENEALQHYSEV